MPKPEEVQKQPKKQEEQKNMSWRPPGLKIAKSFFFFLSTCFLVTLQVLAIFFGFFGTSSGFGNNIVPKPEEVQK